MLQRTISTHGNAQRGREPTITVLLSQFQNFILGLDDIA